MFRKIKGLTAAAMLGAAAMAVGGCAYNLPTKVTRYQAMPAAQGQTFFVVPGGGAAQRNGLEFQRFAAMVAQQLESRGFRQSYSAESADMIVRFGYGVDEGHQVIRSYPSFYGSGFYNRYWGWPYYGHGWGRYGWSDPSWGYGYSSDIDTYTEYGSRVDLDIRDRRTNQSLFEGQAQARSRMDELGTLVPKLVEAMFTNFPGQSGQTVKITIPGKGGESSGY